MRTYRAQRGPFSKQPFFKLNEVEQICTDELRRMSLYPEQPEPIRIDRFIEKKFGVYPAYEDLRPGILGYTEFGPKGVESIIVSRSLVEEGTRPAERRISTTLAHEAGHGLLHAHLFVLAEEMARAASLFGADADVEGPKILCRDEAVAGHQRRSEKRYDGRWWEYQANQAMGALLLPRGLVLVALDGFLSEQGLLRTKVFDETRRAEAASLLSQLFDVNPVVANIRLSLVFPVENASQLTL